MQQTSDTYKRILTDSHWFENSVVLGDNGRLVDDDGGLILFGGDAILVDTSSIGLQESFDLLKRTILAHI